MSRKFILAVAATIFAGISASGQTGEQPATNTGSGGVIVTTPTATLPTPPPTAGISDAGRAGIGANPSLNTEVQSNVENSAAVYTTSAPANSSETNLSTAASIPGGVMNDLGPSYYSDALPA